MKDDELLALRVLKLLPEDRWLSAGALAKAYAERFGPEISTSKMASILQYLFDAGLIQRKKKKPEMGSCRRLYIHGP